MSQVRVAIVSDIHGNRQALEAVLRAAETANVDELWCLGDLVGYGGDPNPCVELIRECATVCLAGNHDLAVLGDLDIDQFSRGAAIAVEWTREVLCDENLSYLRELETKNLGGAVDLYHASPRDPVWEYVLSTLQAELCMDAQRQRIALVGHSHVALAFSRLSGQPASGETRAEGTVVDISTGEWLINPGSVGQPRDGDPRAAWLILDLGAEVATWQRSEYDVAAASAAIRAARLPDSLADRLQYGQ